jgi:hypothetical protein
MALGRLQWIFIAAAAVLFWSSASLCLAAAQSAEEATSTVNCTSRESLESRYARGVLFIDVSDIGVQHCYLTGSIHRAEEDTAKEFTKNTANLPHTAGTPSRLSIFLITRREGFEGVLVSAQQLERACS